MNKFKLEHFNILVLVYISTLSIFYFFHKGLPFQYLFLEVFNEDLSFIIKNKPEKVYQYIVSFDKNFFYFLPIVPLFIYILILIFRFKEIMVPLYSNYYQNYHFPILYRHYLKRVIGHSSHLLAHQIASLLPLFILILSPLDQSLLTWFRHPLTFCLHHQQSLLYRPSSLLLVSSPLVLVSKRPF